MRSPAGLFYAAEDADSEGGEGLFYLWRMQQLEEVLGKEDAAWFGDICNVSPHGHDLDEASGMQTGRNILYRGATAPSDMERFEAVRLKLLEARSRRVRPFRDEKILTDWNGLMIAALAMGGRILNEPEYRDAAATAARLILADMRRQDGRLLHCRYADNREIAATLDDYAFLVWGLIELYEASMDASFLESALELQRCMQHDFADEAGAIS